MKWLFALIIAIVLLSGFWIRWQLAINDPLWIDELHTSWVLSGRWSDIAPRAIAGNQSPLYFWFSYPIVQSLGQSPISLRLLSLVAGCLLPLVGTWAVWSRTGSLLGAFATAVGLSFESHLVFYASEARPYSLVQFGGLVLACTVFARFEGHDSGTHWSSLLLAMVLVLLHPTAILLTVSLALLLFVGRCFPQRRDGWGLILASLIGILLNPATSTWLGRQGLWTGLVDFPQLLCPSIAMLLAAWVFPSAIRSWMQRNERSSCPVAEPALGTDYAKLKSAHAAWYWLCCFLLPLLLATVVSWFQLSGLATPRYLAAIWSFPAIGLGLMIFDLPWKRGLAVAALGLFLLGFGGLPWRTAQGWELIRSNPLLVSLVRERALVGQRNEGWADVHQQLIARSTATRPPIWLYPNLIEDDLLKSEKSNATRLREYLCFPLLGIYSVDGEQLEPRAFRAEQLLSAADIEVLSQREVLVVVRCAESELESLAQAWQGDWETQDAAGKQLKVDRIFSAGDVHLLSLQGATEPRGAEQAN
jgi:hypothetical protein